MSHNTELSPPRQSWVLLGGIPHPWSRVLIEGPCSPSIAPWATMPCSPMEPGNLLCAFFNA